MLKNGRTDLASEARQLWTESAGETTELSGFKARQEMLNGHQLTNVETLDQQGAQALNKPCGKYYTLELDALFERGSESFPNAAAAIAELLGRCVDFSKCSTLLVAALGNPDVTPDALGSIAASNIIVTRHLKHSAPEDFKAFKSTALCRTGVLGTTGIESAVQIKTLCSEIQSDCIIAIDALAGADAARLCRSVQICSTGISPGSGVGNDRERPDAETLGVPVVAVGVPTVIDASWLSTEPDVQSMFVTPRYIDSTVRAGKLIGYGVNLALHTGLTIADIDMLVD